jgi:NCAIR mutase (PurE)-related protein
MDIREVLELYKKGEIEAAKAERLLRLDFIEKIGEHTVFDHSREARKGIPEIIFGEGKTPEQVVEIAEKALEDKEAILISRASTEQYELLVERLGSKGVCIYEKSRLIVVDRRRKRKLQGKIGILTGGTSDMNVAEEVRLVAETMGCEVMIAYDVGIAGLHRFMEPLLQMLKQEVDVLVVVAGMEGALATVISSLADVPVIGLPTSVGYGMGGKGEAALMGMLQSCSPGLVVVNIDNAIAAGTTAALISRRCHSLRDKCKG